MKPEQVRTEPRPRCLLGDFNGPARFVLAEGWKFRYCPKCQLLWLDPCPHPESFYVIYPDGYVTHTPPGPPFEQRTGAVGAWKHNLKLELWRCMYGYPLSSGSLLAKLTAQGLRLLPGAYKRAGWAIRFVRGPGSRLLDVGCGNGQYLVLMRELGWNVEAVEPDARAAAFARQAGIKVA